MSKLATIGNHPNTNDEHYVRVRKVFDNNIRLGTFGSYVEVSGVPIHFDKQYQNISVNLSAGADSTMLAYILCRIIEETGSNTKIHPTSVVRYYNSAQFSETAKERVYGWLKEMFPAIIGDHIWGFIPPALEFTPLTTLVLSQEELLKYDLHLKQNAGSDVLYFTQFNEWAARKYNFDAIYNGTTTNPTTEQIPGAPAFRDSFDTEQYVLSFSNDNISPFFLMEKNWVTAQYSNFDIVDLFNITQSCETVEGGCDNYDTCFHCAERKWSVENQHPYVTK